MFLKHFLSTHFFLENSNHGDNKEIYKEIQTKAFFLEGQFFISDFFQFSSFFKKKFKSFEDFDLILNCSKQNNNINNNYQLRNAIIFKKFVDFM